MHNSALRGSFLAISLMLALGSTRLPAQAFEIDTTTSGGWVTYYGGGGYQIAAGPSSWDHSDIFLEGSSEWVWSNFATRPQALLRPDTRSSIASCYYSDSSFTVTIPFSDEIEHRVAFYFVDWDSNGRVQQVERLDAADAVVEETVLSAFESGKYLIFHATGEIRLRITRLAGVNAVLSGIFLDGPLNDAFLPAPPIIEPSGGTFAGSVTVELIAPSADSHPYYTVLGTDPATDGVTYQGPIVLTESRTIRVVSRNIYGHSAETTATFTIVPSTDAVEFLGLDSTTLGNWKGNYGREGYFVPYFAPEYAGNFSIDLSGTDRWVWAWPSASPSALQKPVDSDRYAACWFTPNVMTFGLTFAEDREHIISLHALDWDQAGRSQKFELLDAQSGQILDTQVISDFSAGTYLRWRVSSDVNVRITRLAGPNAVLSGIFLGSSYLEQAQPPVFSPNGGTFAGPVQVSLSTPTAGAAIRYTTDGSTPTEASDLYTAPLTLETSVTLQAIAFKAGLQASAVHSAYFNLAASGGTSLARFLGEDRTTQGAWLSTSGYGEDGFILPGDWTIWTNDTSFSFIGGTQHIWAYNVNDARALEKYSSPGRVAACQYSPEKLVMPLTFNGNAPHRVSFYFLDWDSSQRVQRVEVLDTSTGLVLDSRQIQSFHEGIYLTWEVTASVTFQVTRLQGANAVVSGVFMNYAE